jgi:hypothetical protein
MPWVPSSGNTTEIYDGHSVVEHVPNPDAPRHGDDTSSAFDLAHFEADSKLALEHRLHGQDLERGSHELKTSCAIYKYHEMSQCSVDRIWPRLRGYEIADPLRVFDFDDSVVCTLYVPSCAMSLGAPSGSADIRKLHSAVKQLLVSIEIEL